MTDQTNPTGKLVRCPWAANPLSIVYHDQEWGVPIHDDRRLFEFLILEGAQAGLSWDTILKKREHYRLVYDGFEAATIAGYNDKKQAELLADPGIIRNRLKLKAAVLNARAFLKVQTEFGSFDSYIWGFVHAQPIQNHRSSLSELPTRTMESDAMSRDLLKRGFKFAGSTICYAYMQAVGMVNDHLVDCYRYNQIRALSKARLPKRS